jgi:hypothetical protein
VRGREEKEVSSQLHIPAAVFPVKELTEWWVNHIKAGPEALEKDNLLACPEVEPRSLGLPALRLRAGGQ